MQLVLEQVGYSYGIADRVGFALQDINLTVGDGDFLGIIGHSGSGKSTLIQLAAALLRPSSGRVLLDGADLALAKNRTQLFTRIGVAFQYPENQLFAPTVFEDIAFAARNARFSPQEIKSRVEHWMQVFGLDYDSYAPCSPFELSGGEQRRVALAGIMVVEPDLVILDEPTAGLDPAGRNLLLQVIRDYHRQGHSVIMVSHSMDDVAQVVNRIVVMKSGQVCLEGSPEEVFARYDELERINLGLPAAEQLAMRLRQAGLPLPPSLLSVNELAHAIAELAGVSAPATEGAAELRAAEPEAEV